MTTQADYIIQRFGGSSALAGALGRKPSSVNEWKKRGYVPARYHSLILAVGASLKPPLLFQEFLEDLDGERHTNCQYVKEAAE